MFQRDTLGEVGNPHLGEKETKGEAMTEPEGGKGPYDFTIVASDIIRNSRGSVEAQGLICAALEDAYAAGRASRDDLRKALESARKTIAGFPMSLGYYITSLPEIDKALSADEEAGK